MSNKVAEEIAKRVIRNNRFQSYIAQWQTQVVTYGGTCPHLIFIFSSIISTSLRNALQL
ncbi:unnamed protein product [Brassica oleracea var. botrytis]|uniref:BnaC08g10300D protein n=3 Tax=Brassica TaxID=3705 RepID=A0A078F6R6_BRANA|nr:BnaC08g10300D [Brassica napus]VDD55061.1 unnamed protein product [Brassica oleracea]